MSNTWRWIIGIVVGLALIGLLLYGRSDRQAYRIARGAVSARVEISQDRIEMATQMATTAVDLALLQAGNLPSQQVKADLIKQDIQEISDRLKEAAQARGNLAMTKLDASIELFNQALSTIDEAANTATDPAVKTALERIYGNLEAVKGQLVQTILNTQQ
jgi:hypothetical protein